MGLLNKCIQLDHVLPKEYFFRIDQDLKSNGWKNTNVSDKDKYLSWGKIEENIVDPFAYISAGCYIKYKIQKYLRTSDLDLSKIHINGQTSNQPSLFHTDSGVDGTYTFVLFTNLNWDSNWGGEFTILNPLKNKYEFYPYIPNSGVLIDSTWDHRGNCPNNLTYKLRTSVAFVYNDLNVRDRYEGSSIIR